MPKGGFRPNAGRPPGRKNNATLHQEKIKAEIADKFNSDCANLDIENLDALDMMMTGARILFQKGDIKSAAYVASLAAPYRHSKKAQEAPEGVGMPHDLQPDPAPSPDEPGPADPIL